MNASKCFPLLSLTLLCALSCVQPAERPDEADPLLPPLTLGGVAQLFSSLPLTQDHVREVQDAVCASASGGYDEEYMLCDLFTSPGAGVGSGGQTRAGASYAHPLREVVRAYLEDRVRTRSGDGSPVEAYLDALSASGMQIYWPYSDSWDGETMPVITFDPESEAETNVGYQTQLDPDGTVRVRQIVVDEEMARSRPVWVINANDDSAFLTLEQLRRQDPDWGKGGRILVGSVPGAPFSDRVRADGPGLSGGSRTRAEGDFRTLILKDFRANKSGDPWFRGASEYWVKCGSVQGFTASTEAELRLYEPSVTDFLITVRRSQIGKTQPFDAILISDWTDQLDSFAFLITEDDGGTRTSWKMEAMVKINSKSYGITIELPYNDRDDIIWRGSLTSRFFERYEGSEVHFGDVDVTFEIR